MFAYCNNNPTISSDPTGYLAFPGEIHNEVVRRYAQKYALNKEQTISYSFGWGRADLISDDGYVWDVKPDNIRSIKMGKKQVKKYADNIWKNHPDVDLQIGGDIEGMTFDYKSGYTTYHVTCRDAGEGVIAYSYTMDIDWDKVGQAAVAGVCALVLGALTYFTGGATQGAFQQAVEMIP